MITKEFQPTVPLFYRASREIYHLTFAGRAFYGFFVGGALILIALSMALDGFVWSRSMFGIPTWGIICATLVYVFILTPLIQYRAIKTNVKSNPSASARQYYEITENGLKNHGEGFSVDLSWEKICKIRVSKSFVLFFVSRNFAYFIPKNLVSEAEIEQVRQWKDASRESHPDP